MKGYVQSEKMQTWDGFPKIDEDVLIIYFREEIRLAHRRINLRIMVLSELKPNGKHTS